LQEVLDLSFDRLLMMMMHVYVYERIIVKTFKSLRVGRYVFCLRNCYGSLKSGVGKGNMILVQNNLSQRHSGQDSWLSHSYRYAPHNDVTVNDGGPIRLYYNTFHCITIAYSMQYCNTLYRFLA